MKGYLLRRTLIKCIHTFEAEPVVECGDCGGSRKVATYHNPSQLWRKKVVLLKNALTSPTVDVSIKRT